MMPPASAGLERLWKTLNRCGMKVVFTFVPNKVLIPMQDNNCDDPHADLVMSKKALSLFQEDEEHGQRKTKRKVPSLSVKLHFSLSW